MEKCAGLVLGGCAYFTYVGIGYLLMLAVMTFHTGMFLTVVSGVTVGKVVFGHILKSPQAGKGESLIGHSGDELCH